MRIIRPLVATSAITNRDRMANGLLTLFAVLNLVFFLLFAMSLVTARATLAAEQTCGGENLVEKLKLSDPTKFGKVLAEAAAVENGHSVMWRITRDGLAPSFLLGTMHSADPRVTLMPAPADAAFAQAEVVLIENTEVLDRTKMTEALMRYKEMTLLLDGSTLDQKIAEGSIPTLQAAVTQRNMPWEIARHMQPWMVAAAIAIPICEVVAKSGGAEVLDTTIGNRALAQGKRLIGLETIEEQFRAVSSIPQEFHLNALSETLQLSDLTDSMMETTKLLYLKGETGMLLPLVRAYSPQTYSGKGYAEFQELLVSRRNHTMAERALSHLEKGNVFMAVGALHLSGEEGLVNLLRQQGFRLEAVEG
ncbi:MAG: TraB/GumN family protein [Nitratireductor sp.]